MKTEKYNDKSLALTEFISEAQEKGYRGGSYGQMWRAILSGDIPAQRIGKRWHVRRADLPMIADALGWRRESTEAA